MFLYKEISRKLTWVGSGLVNTEWVWGDWRSLFFQSQWAQSWCLLSPNLRKLVTQYEHTHTHTQFAGNLFHTSADIFDTAKITSSNDFIFSLWLWFKIDNWGYDIPWRWSTGQSLFWTCEWWKLYRGHYHQGAELWWLIHSEHVSPACRYQEFIPDGDLLPLPRRRTQLCHYALRLTQPVSLGSWKIC